MAGAFDAGFDSGFDIGLAPPPTPALVELVLDLSVDDHPRPDHPLWRRYGYPNTQAGLLLYMDGRVQVVTSFDLNAVLAADDYIAGGHRVIIDPSSWQAVVLVAAGYQLLPYEGTTP